METVCLLGREIVNDKNVEYAHVDYEPKDAEYLKSANDKIKVWKSFVDDEHILTDEAMLDRIEIVKGIGYTWLYVGGIFGSLAFFLSWSFFKNCRRRIENG